MTAPRYSRETALRFAEAYLRLYPDKEAALFEISPGARGWKRQSIQKAVTRLVNHPIVQEAVSRARSAVEVITAACTLADHLGQLARLREIAVTERDLAAAIAAERLRGQVMGYYSERPPAQQQALTQYVDRPREQSYDEWIERRQRELRVVAAAGPAG